MANVDQTSQDSNTPAQNSPIEPLPYSRALADHLASAEREAWQWFSEDLAGPDHAESVRLDLLKATYRFDRETKSDLYALGDKVRGLFGLGAPLTLYQMQQAPEGGLNTALFYIPGEIHIAFVGPVRNACRAANCSLFLGTNSDISCYWNGGIAGSALQRSC